MHAVLNELTFYFYSLKFKRVVLLTIDVPALKTYFCFNWPTWSTDYRLILSLVKEQMRQFTVKFIPSTKLCEEQERPTVPLLPPGVGQEWPLMPLLPHSKGQEWPFT